MNHKGNIVIVVLAAVGMVALLLLGLYAQQQLIYTGSGDPGRQTEPSGPADLSGTGTTEDTAEVTDPTETEPEKPTETTPATQPEETQPATQPPTQPPETRPTETQPTETVPQDPEPTEETAPSGDELPLLPM